MRRKDIKTILKILPVMSLTLLLSSCGGSDNTVENWFVTILFLLALMKRG